MTYSLVPQPHLYLRRAPFRTSFPLQLFFHIGSSQTLNSRGMMDSCASSTLCDLRGILKRRLAQSGHRQNIGSEPAIGISATLVRKKRRRTDAQSKPSGDVAARNGKNWKVSSFTLRPDKPCRWKRPSVWKVSTSTSERSAQNLARLHGRTGIQTSSSSTRVGMV